MSARHLLLAAALAAAVALPAGCGDDAQDRTADTATATAPAGATRGAADPRSAIQQWFTAKRHAWAGAGCALETDRFQAEQYGGTGEACRNDEGNRTHQTVRARTIRVVSLERSGSTALATIEPNAGSSARARIGLVQTDGRWLVDSLR